MGAMVAAYPIATALIGGAAVAGGTAYIAGDAQRKATNASNDAAARLAAQINQPPPVMPVANDAAAEKAKRRSLSEQMSRRGRASTILSQGLTGADSADKLGG